MFTWGPRSSGEGDPLFSLVQVLLHFDGADGSTTVIDSSSYAAHTTTGTANSIRTAHSKFGGSSLRCDTIQPSPLLFTGSRFARASNVPLCAEGWVKNVTQASNTIAPQVFRLNDQFGVSMLNVGRYGNAGRVYVQVGSNPAVNYAATYDASGFCHLAFDVDSSNNYRFFAGGVLLESGSFAHTSSTAACSFTVGSNALGGATAIEVYIDEVRLTIGASRYPAAFTPPPAPFPSSA